MGMAAILFNNAEPFEQIDRRPNEKSGENWSSCFREAGVQRLRDFIHICSPGVRAENPGGQNFDCN